MLAHEAINRLARELDGVDLIIERRVCDGLVRWMILKDDREVLGVGDTPAEAGLRALKFIGVA
jgi:hypothetical protein